MCGVVGIVSRTAVNQQIYDALTVLQHRGQDAAGIVTCDAGHLFLRKGNGLVSDVFQHQLRWARTYRICRPGGSLPPGRAHRLGDRHRLFARLQFRHAHRQSHYPSWR